MDLLPYLQRLFAYDDWANREVLDSLARAGGRPARSLKLLSHIVAAEALWLARLRREKSPMAVWPELTLDECRARVEPSLKRGKADRAVREFVQAVMARAKVNHEAVKAPAAGR